METKKWYQSKTFVAAIIWTVFSALNAAFGVGFNQDEARQIAEAVFSPEGGTVIGVIFAVLRIVTTKPINFR